MIFNKFLFIAILTGGFISAEAQLEIHPSLSIDLGEFPAESPPIASFDLVNTGSVCLVITDVKSSCPCFNPVVYITKIPSHESVPLDIFIHTDLLFGTFEKTVQIKFKGNTTTHTVVTVKGTVVHPIFGIPSFIATDRTAIGQSWSTNLLLTLRKDLSTKPTIQVDGHPHFKGQLLPTKNPKAFNLQLYMSPQENPAYWESQVVFRFDPSLKIRPMTLKINGYAGGTLHPSIRKLNPKEKKASILLQRIYPTKSQQTPSPLRCNNPRVSITETHQAAGQSLVVFSFSDALLEQLTNKGRIPIQLTTDGFIPISLVLE